MQTKLPLLLLMLGVLGMDFPPQSSKLQHTLAEECEEENLMFYTCANIHPSHVSPRIYSQD